MRCARCRAHATHQARRHRVTIPMCTNHHRHVWQDLVADGWIVSIINTGTPTIRAEHAPEARATT